MKRLLLFDIDGTLLHANGSGRVMLGNSLRAVYGTAGTIDSYEFGGRTDRRMVLDLLTAEGLSLAEIELGLPQLYDEMCRQSDVLFSGGRLAPCPGAAELLRELRGLPHVLLGLLTGNIAGTAPIKLRAAGLDPALFRVGAFGSDTIERDDLLPIAWQRAAAMTGITFTGRETIIIGDTPADIQCARSGSARAVAVTTGHYSRERLAGCAPDLVLYDLSDTAAVLDILLS